MIDVVYILGKESRWADTEIKYSVRSVEKYLTGYRKIWLIGQKPMFFNEEINEIPYQDIYGNKARNIMAKILRAANDTRITKKFILFNDDYFLLKPCHAEEYPYLYKNTLPEALERNRTNYDFYKHLQSTIDALGQHGLPMLNFDSHYPIVYDAHKVKRVIEKYNWNVSHGYVFKSLYCNTIGITGEHREDCKINHPHVFSNWPNVTKGLEMFSIGDRCINKSMEQYLHYLYPHPSRYEHAPRPTYQL